MTFYIIHPQYRNMNVIRVLECYNFWIILHALYVQVFKKECLSQSWGRLRLGKFWSLDFDIKQSNVQTGKLQAQSNSNFLTNPIWNQAFTVSHKNLGLGFRHVCTFDSVCNLLRFLFKLFSVLAAPLPSDKADATEDEVTKGTDDSLWSLH